MKYIRRKNKVNKSAGEAMDENIKKARDAKLDMQRNRTIRHRLDDILKDYDFIRGRAANKRDKVKPRKVDNPNKLFADVLTRQMGYIDAMRRGRDERLKDPDTMPEVEKQMRDAFQRVDNSQICHDSYGPNYGRGYSPKEIGSGKYRKSESMPTFKELMDFRKNDKETGIVDVMNIHKSGD